MLVFYCCYCSLWISLVMFNTSILFLLWTIVCNYFLSLVSSAGSCVTLNPASFLSNVCYGAVDYSFYLPSNYTLGKQQVWFMKCKIDNKYMFSSATKCCCNGKTKQSSVANIASSLSERAQETSVCKCLLEMPQRNKCNE